jgi:predicted nucleic acid-binding protein
LRQEYAFEVLSKAKTFVILTEEVEKQARDLDALGIKPLDALHLALAEEAQADYFCTCDDQLLKKAKVISSIKTKAVSPVELIEELEQWK